MIGIGETEGNGNAHTCCEVWAKLLEAMIQ